MVFRTDSFRFFSWMKILRWSFTYPAMVSNNSQWNWFSWFTARNWLVFWVEDLGQRHFLDFLFLCFFFHFLLLCPSLLLELDEEESREEVELILRKLLSQDIDFFFLFLLSFEPFSERSRLFSALSTILFWPKCEKTFLQRFFEI